jgi:hypothetical protein
MRAGDRMKAKDLCLALMRADTQDEVVKLLTDAGYWNQTDAWRYVGDNENNFSGIGNQQSEAVAALIEKIVNAEDARLVNACLEAGVDPSSDAAPNSIRQAVARFFEHKNSFDLEKDGRIFAWSDELATAEGRLLTVAATGNVPADGAPSISVADQGEGQCPEDFPETFMSLHRSNKLRIHFVQGKFNMGGTGALQFCAGPHHLQLVVSRRNPSLVSNRRRASDNDWGFTIVRREPPAGRRSSVFTYLAPVDADERRMGNVLSFASETLPIFPEADGSVRSANHRMASHGSLVKLYEYEWQGTRSNIVQSGGGLLRRLDFGLPELALPVRVFECRLPYKGHSGSFATNALGLAARLERDKGDNLEPDFPVGSVIDLDGRAVRARVFALKKGKASEYRAPKQGIVFAVNGQSHATLPVDFYRRKAVGMGYLADSLLVMVDCTNVEGEMREDLFMNSRDRLRTNQLSQRLEAELERFLRDDPALRALRNKRREEELADKLADSKPLTDILQDILRHSPTLAKLFLQGIKIASPFPPTTGTGEGISDQFEGKTYPTYFRIRDLKYGEQLRRDAHLESRARILFETDANDDYFIRDLDHGECGVWLISGTNETAVHNWAVHGPRSGGVTLTLDLPADARVGDSLRFEVRVTDPSRVEPFVNSITLLVRPPASPSPGGKGGQRTATSGAGTRGGGSSLSLPNIVEVDEEHWADHSFTESTALVLKNAGQDDAAPGAAAIDVYDFYVNVDNKFLRIAQKESKDDPKLLKAKFVYGLVLVGLAFLQHDRNQPVARSERDDDSSEDGEDDDAPGIESAVAYATTALAPVLLPMLESIGALTVSDED